MPSKCVNEWCEKPSHRAGARCPDCARIWRNAKQRDSRNDPDPVGPLPAPITRDLINVVSALRDALDRADHRHQQILDEYEPVAAMQDLLADTLREIRAKIVDLRQLIAGWEAANKTFTG
jgi:Zn-dependent M32 family carboxypeptidase